MIIRILTDKFPLTAKKIYNMAVKRHNCHLRFRTFRFHIVNLLKDKVLIKNPETREYHLNPKWIEQNNNRNNDINIRYSKLLTGSIFKSADTVKTAKCGIFLNFKDFATSLASARNDFINSAEKGAECGWVANHVVLGTLDFNGRIKIGQMMNERRISYYTIIRGRTPLDEVMKDLYTKSGLNMITGVKEESAITYVGVYGNRIYFTIFPDSLNKIIEHVYEKSRDNKKLGMIEVLGLVDELSMKLSKINDKIICVEVKNRELAEYYMNHIKSFFNKG